MDAFRTPGALQQHHNGVLAFAPSGPKSGAKSAAGTPTAAAGAGGLHHLRIPQDMTSSGAPGSDGTPMRQQQSFSLRAVRSNNASLKQVASVAPSPAAPAAAAAATPASEQQRRPRAWRQASMPANAAEVLLPPASEEPAAPSQPQQPQQAPIQHPITAALRAPPSRIGHGTTHPHHPNHHHHHPATDPTTSSSSTAPSATLVLLQTGATMATPSAPVNSSGSDRLRASLSVPLANSQVPAPQQAEVAEQFDAIHLHDAQILAALQPVRVRSALMMPTTAGALASALTAGNVPPAFASAPTEFNVAKINVRRAAAASIAPAAPPAAATGQDGPADEAAAALLLAQQLSEAEQACLARRVSSLRSASQMLQADAAFLMELHALAELDDDDEEEGDSNAPLHNTLDDATPAPAADALAPTATVAAGPSRVRAPLLPAQDQPPQQQQQSAVAGQKVSQRLRNLGLSSSGQQGRLARLVSAVSFKLLPPGDAAGGAEHMPSNGLLSADGPESPAALRIASTISAVTPQTCTTPRDASPGRFVAADGDAPTLAGAQQYKRLLPDECMTPRVRSALQPSPFTLQPGPAPPPLAVVAAASASTGNSGAGRGSSSNGNIFGRGHALAGATRAPAGGVWDGLRAFSSPSLWELHAAGVDAPGEDCSIEEPLTPTAATAAAAAAGAAMLLEVYELKVALQHRHEVGLASGLASGVHF